MVLYKPDNKMEEKGSETSPSFCSNLCFSLHRTNSLQQDLEPSPVSLTPDTSRLCDMSRMILDQTSSRNLRGAATFDLRPY